MRERARIALIVLLGVVVGVCALSSQSLWIDEANSAVKAVAPTWGDFVSKMAVERGSDLQMPLYMASLWGWEKLVGSSEFALRSLNILFFTGALVLMGAFLQTGKNTRITVVLFACLSPFLWSYLNEARPYILEFFAAAMMLVGLTNLVIDSKQPPQLRDGIFVLLGLFLLFASSLATIPFVLMYGVAFVILWLRRESLVKTVRNKQLLLLLITVAVAGLLVGLYYLWTLKVGARASSVAKTNVISTIFCFYELFGFLGLGPGRSALREAPLASLHGYALPLLIYGLAWAGMMGLIFRSFLPANKREKRALMVLGGAVMIAVLMMLMIGVFKEFRVLGRHLMPAYPFLLLGVAWGVTRSVARCGVIAKSVMTAFLIISLIACLELRFSNRHDKDDYRDAAAAAKMAQAQGQTIWWAADPAGACYYGLATVTPGGLSLQKTNETIQVMNPTGKLLAGIPTPDMIILSKADIYDATGEIREWIAKKGYSRIKTFPSFGIYAR